MRRIYACIPFGAALRRACVRGLRACSAAAARDSVTTRAGCSLVLGLVSTVALTWALVIFPRDAGTQATDREGSFTSHGVFYFISELSTNSRTIVTWHAIYKPPRFPRLNPDRPWIDQLTRIYREDAEREGVRWDLDRPGWGWLSGAGVADPTVEDGYQVGWGWPWRTLWHAKVGHLQRIPPENIGSWQPAVIRSPLGSANLPGLPIRPVWPGLVGSTLLHAALWYLALGLPGTLRRWVRRRRGLCPDCAYDLRGTSREPRCPECGRLMLEA